MAARRWIFFWFWSWNPECEISVTTQTCIFHTYKFIFYFANAILASLLYENIIFNKELNDICFVIFDRKLHLSSEPIHLLASSMPLNWEGSRWSLSSVNWSPTTENWLKKILNMFFWVIIMNSLSYRGFIIVIQLRSMWGRLWLTGKVIEP